MKRIIYTVAAALLTASGFAQTDTTKNDQPDTVRVGNFVIIKKNKNGSVSDSSDQHRNVYVDINVFGNNRNKHKSKVSTNWLIFDLGFANVRDKTEYGSAEANSYLNAQGGTPFTKSDLALRTSKSSNANIWLFMQKLNVSKHVLNLKYGLGLEMYNYRYENNISYTKNPASIVRDSVNFSKNKLYVGYATVPFMVNINTNPDKRKSFSISAGVSAGYKIASRNKQISGDRGKEKTNGDFNLDPWRLAAIAEVGLGPVRLYGSYSFNTLHQDGLKQYPYAVGIRFSNW
ncbi:MAG TPA: outer membrane beta-barrel protein [Panacibacter sp.]|nr:outer membrane beta-barrel protein [Panacibacter sp.]